MVVISADPGTTGAVAALCSVRGLLEITRVPVVNRGRGERKVNFVDASALRSILREWSHRHRFAADEVQTVMERTHAGPQMGGSAVLQMGHAAGVIEGVLSCMFAVPELVEPREWKRMFNLSAKKGESVKVVQRLYPDAPSRLAHDKAEAVLIGHWLMVTRNGERMAA